LEKEELNRIIEALESTNSDNAAYLATDMYDDRYEEYCIKGNKAGLELLASQLLKASRDYVETPDDNEISPVTIDYGDNWNEGDIIIKYILPSEKKQDKTDEESFKSNLSDKIMRFGCISVILFIVIALIVGVSSIFKWVF